MNRSCALALALLLAFWLAAAALLLTAITPATGTPPTAAGRIPASAFAPARPPVPPIASGTPNPSVATGAEAGIAGRNEAPPSGVGQAAVLSPARDPSNGRESPRHRPALRGAETAGGGPSSPFGCRAARPQFWGALGAESQPCGVRDGGLNAGRSLTASAPASTGLSAARPGTIRTIASWMPERFGATYLALPEGAGHRVTICGAAACVTLTSCDAGPSLAMQRAGRTVDLGVLTWEYVTGLPRSRGLAWVTVRRE